MSALAGSAIGAFASLVTTWITQHYQSAQLRQNNESSRRERLFGDFIDQASTIYADALVNSLNEPTKLVRMVGHHPIDVELAREAVAQVLEPGRPGSILDRLEPCRRHGAGRS